MNNKDKIIINKMLKYCRDSIKYIEESTFEEFTNNELTFTFSIFALSQLGELVIELSDECKQKHSEIPWNAIKSVRNRIVHNYEGVTYKIIWDTLKNDIPTLIKQLENILEDL